MMWKNKVVLGTTAIGLMAVLAGCGGSKQSASTEQTFKIMDSDVIQTMDPALATDIISGQTMLNTYAGLYRYDGKKLKPDMAAKMATVTNNNLTYTFKLRKDAKWTDGKTVTAQDFEYAWKRAVDPNTKSQYAYIFSGIKNADDIMAGKKSASTLGVKALNKTTFQVNLEKPIPYFESMITLQTFDPVEKSQVEKYGSKYGTKSSTLTFNGPYVLKNWNGANNTWTVTKNKKYWNAKNVHIGKITTQVVKEASTALNLFQDGKLDDVKLNGNAATQNSKSSEFHNVKQTGVFYLEPNANKVPEFKNVKIRQALSLAINRKQFIKQVLGNGSQPAKSVVAANMMFNSKGTDYVTALGSKSRSYNDYDLTKARQLFKEGMAELGEKSFTFELTGDDTDNAKATQDYLQSAFEKLSTKDAKVTVKARSVPFKQRVALGAAHNFQMLITAWAPDFPDAISFLDLFRGDNPTNDAQWKNADYDAALKQAGTTYVADPAKRWTALVDAGRILSENVGAIPLYQVGESHMTKKTVKNLQYTPSGLVDYVGATNKTSK